ncbi:inositol monophosphatase family protein [Burkholderia multivorans]|uniref:Histidinol-phosphatase n=1 Tax=Burkholderia multivorans TaxID=87883 RepID=A0AB37ALI8_9BURK|nr:inositol monophosphatase family protein [Burkholderia multivorans]MBU9589639.1 histidinol-phosphatase [Burkholderia multivorans]PRE39287.1 histidinol-phosphatase [Burkholderia multivorans]PRE42291.1 histidinol-phosphatase [Burkholderia multivorans]
MTTEFERYSGMLDAAERTEFLPFLRELASVSSSIVRQHYLTGVAVDWKSDHTPVTAADRLSEHAMRTLIAERYPDHGILGEEFGMVRPRARYRWVLDPIDGTKPFTTNCYIFGTLIALMRDEAPILGAIGSPLTGHLLIGLGGAQTELNGKTVRVRDCPTIEDAIVLTTGHWETVGRPYGHAFGELSRRARMYRTWGDCHGYFQVATGGADIMLDPMLKAWDICALVPVVEGAGGRVTTIDGGNPLHGDNLLATNSVLHERVLAALAAPI